LGYGVLLSVLWVYLFICGIEIGPFEKKLYIYRKPGERPGTRIKPLPLGNGNGRYMTVRKVSYIRTDAFVRLVMAVVPVILLPFHFRNGYVTAVSFLKSPRGGFRSGTTTWTWNS
jgi:hypothetical protein